MRQWIENLAKKIKTAEYSMNGKFRNSLLINHEYDVTVYKSDGEKYLQFYNDYICQHIKVYEDEYDLIANVLEQRTKELSQQEIDKFISLCK